jgi:hypothetical protein
MARAKLSKPPTLVDSLGVLIGEALGEGLGAGLEGALGQVRVELARLGEDVGALLARASLPEAAAPAEDPSLRACAERGCERRAIARGLCRRHYARLVYRERKAREGRPPPALRGPRLLPSPAKRPASGASERKPAPVAPLVRRKSADGSFPAADAPKLHAVASPGPQAVTAESVARFLGLKE